MKQISQETINAIKGLLIKRNPHKEIKEILDGLPEADDTKDELRKLIANVGRSNMVSVDELNELIEDF